MLLSKETYKSEVQLCRFFKCLFCTVLLQICLLNACPDQSDIFVNLHCAVLHVQIMPEHINISFEQTIKQSLYSRGVKDA